MKVLKKTTGLLLTAAMITSLGSITALAATKTKINSVNIKVEASIEPGTDYGEEEIEVTVKSGKCEFVDYEILNEENDWSINEVPKIQVILEAADNYYFPSTLTASSIKISGGTYISATRAESNTQLKITMTLPSLMTYVGEVGAVTIDHNGVASWEPVMGAAEYSVRLYRDGSSAGNWVTTADTSYNFSAAMLRSGSYSVRLRAINGMDPNNKSETEESGTVFISDETAAANKENNSGKPGEWKQDENGWWYSQMDGAYPASSWEKILGRWYAFDAAGYMRTGWVTLDGKTYYFNPENGAMVTNATVEGQVLGADGAMIQ